MEEINPGKNFKKWILKILFWFLIILSLFLTLNTLRINKYRFGVMGFYYPLKPISVNLSFNNPVNNNLFLCFNSYCKRAVSLSSNKKTNLSDTYSIQLNYQDKSFFNTPINNIYLLYQGGKKYIENIDRIDIYIDDEKYHYYKDDILSWKNKNIAIDDVSPKKYDAKILNIKNNLKDKKIRNSIYFLSLFYHWELFITPYLLAFIAFLIFLFRKDVIPDKIKNISYKWYLTLFILIGTFLRFTGLNYRTLWLDEIYTKEVAVNSFKSCFLDPGNPPLFFILEFIIKKLGFTSDFSLRFLSFVFGILFIYVVFLLFKKIDKKLALFACFFASVNLILIFFSYTLRSYSLDNFLCILSIYYLFKYLDNPKTKNLIIYFLISVCLINVHYICTIFALSNLVWGISVLLKTRKKEVLKFASINSIAFFTFIPYFLLTFQTSLFSRFNSWIKPLSKDVVSSQLIEQFFINKYVFLVFLLLILITFIFSILPENKRKRLCIDELKRGLFIYLIYSLTFVGSIVIIISLLIKPIFTYRVIYAIYSLLFLVQVLLISTIFDFKKINFKPLISLKTLYSLILICITFSCTNTNCVFQLTNRLDDFVDFIKIDIKKYPDYLVYIIVNDTKEYLNYYPDIKNLNVIYKFINTNFGQSFYGINEEALKKQAKKVLIYFYEVSTNIAELKKDYRNRVYVSNSGEFGKIIYNWE